MNKKEVRWPQRFTNFQKAFQQLEKGLKIQKPSDIEKQGIIQSFEFTFELAWNTIKDFLESENVISQYPRSVIKDAFKYEIIKNGEIWIEMLEDRNMLAHTYNEDIANKAYNKIKDIFFNELELLYKLFQSKL